MITISEEYTELGQKIVSELFPELEDVQIAWLSSNEKKGGNGKTIYADCTKVNKRYEWCCPFDFMITVYNPNVARFNDKQLAILLEHELMHIGNGKVNPHDTEDFAKIIEKYGVDWART